MESTGCLAKMIDIDRVARVVFERRKEQPRRGRVPKLYQKTWDELDDSEQQTIKDEVRDVIEALISEGTRFEQVIRRKTAFRSAIKTKKGELIVG